MASYIIHILVTFLCLRLRWVFGQDYTYLDCFYDSNERETLPDLIYCDRTRHPYETCQNICGPQAQYCQSDSMTIELCRDICADQNMKYFGLQASSQCLCGGFFAVNDLVEQPTGSNGTCNQPCTGDPSQMCGADFQSSVYQINEPASDCFNPGYVLNGDQSQQDSSFYNATDSIDFSSVCSSPSIKNGAASITCSASGNWTDPPPTCTVRCATPTAPMYASFSAGQTLNDSYAVDDAVLYDCDNDGSKTNQELTCGYYGDWEIVLPAMDCPEPTTTVTKTTQPTTTLQPTTMMSSTTSITTPTTSMTSGVGSTTPQPVVTVANATVSPATTPIEVPTSIPATNVTTAGSTSASSGGSTTTRPSTISMSTMLSTVTSTPQPPSTDGTTSTPSSTSSGAPSSSSSSPSSMTSNDANSSSDPMTMMTSSPGGQGTSTPSITGGGERTTIESEKNTGGEMDLIPIIIGAAAGAFLLILVIIVVSVCCSRKRKQKTKKIPFDPALGTSFGNPAFEEDEAEQSRRGFVQENDYGDRQQYDIGVSDYAMDVDETNRVPPDGKDSPGVNGTEDATYAVVNKNRQGSVTSFKPSDDHRVSWATLPPHHNNDINDIYEGNRHSPLIQENGYNEAYYTDPNNQVATPL